MEDCFHGVICFETLNPPVGLGSDGMDEGQTENVQTQILCKPSVQAMEAAIAIANVDPEKTVITENLPIVVTCLQWWTG